MNRRRWWFGGLALGLFVLGVLFAYQALNSGPIRYENFDNVREGMTEDEVEAVLGCRHGDYTTGTVHVKRPYPDGMMAYWPMPIHELERADRDVPPFGTWHMWYGDHGLIAVSFNAENKVIRKKQLHGRRLPPDWWHWLEWRFGFEDIKHRA
jgi:hypothetical protein